MAVALSLFTSCAQQQRIQSDLDKIAQFSMTDLQAAQADAMRHNDALAMACYPVLEQWVAQLNAERMAPPVGAFSAFQAARDGVKGASSGIPTYVKIGCAALFIDVRDDMVKLVGFLASIGIKGAGALPVIP